MSSAAVQRRKGHNKAVDYWSIGILIFEMLSGMPPFYDDNPMITYTKIFAGKITWPKTINSTAKATPNAPCLCLDLVEMSRVPVIHNMSWY